MENTLYYTFSTISQTLGGAIALLGAFILYKIQTIDNELNILLSKVVSYYHYRFNIKHKKDEKLPSFQDMFLSKNYTGAYELIHNKNVIFELKEDSNTISDPTDYTIRFSELYKTKSDLLSNFKYSLILTISTIILSVLFLSRTHTICKSSACIMIAIGVGLFSICLIFYGIIIYEAIKN